MSVRSSVLHLSLALLGSAAAFAQSADETETYRRWVDELADAEFDVREQAFQNLWRAGRPALPFVEQAAASEDLEIRDRAERLLPLLEWSITPELWEKAQASLEGYDEASIDEKTEILRTVRAAAGRTALPFFRAVIEAEEDATVWQAAVESAWDLAGGQMTEWLESLAESGRAGGPVYRYLAERYSRLAPADVPREKILRYTQAILGRERGFSDPIAYSYWMSALLALGEDDLADEVFQAGLDATGGTREYRIEGARRLLEIERPERALEVVDPLLEDPANVPDVVRELVRHRQGVRSWEVARAAMDEFPLEDLKQRLFEVYRETLEFDHARAVAEAMTEIDPAGLAQLHRYTLDADRGLVRSRARWEALAADRDADARVRAEALVEYADDALYYGLASEAWAACKTLDVELLVSIPKGISVGIRASAAAGEHRVALDLGDRPGAIVDEAAEGTDIVARALLDSALALGDEERALRFLGRSDGEIDMVLRTYAATGERSAIDNRPMGRVSRDSFPFDATYCLGAIAEKEGRPGEALYQYCRALAEIGSKPNTRLAWHWDDVHRKAGYLARQDGAVRDARAEAAKIVDPGNQARVDGEILRQTGDWAGAAARLDAWLEAIGKAAAPEDRLDVAWTHIEAGQLERAEALLAPSRERGAETAEGRIALHLSRLAAGKSNDAATSATLREVLFGRRVDQDVAYHSAFFLSSRAIDDLAVEEWESILANPEPGTNFPFALSNAWEYLTIVFDRQDREPERCADYFLRGLQACWVNNYTIIERGGEPSYRARIEHWLGKVELSKGNRDAAALRFRRALGLFPYHLPSARALADLVRSTQPDLASRVDRLSIAELGRRRAAEPANPEPPYQLALALQAADKKGEALEAARQAATLSSESRYAELVQKLSE